MKTPQPIKTIIAAGMIAVPMLAFNVHAFDGTREWKPSDSGSTSGLWSDATSWIPVQSVPDGLKEVFFKYAGQIPCVIDGAATPGRLSMGDNGPGGTIIVTNGGSLNPVATDFLAVGYNNPAQLIVGNGGSVRCPDHLWVGLFSPSVGTFIMNGGTVAVSGQLGLGFEGGTGFAHINGGTLYLTNFIAGPGALHVAINDSSILDIAGGTVVINGNRVVDVSAYIANGRITGYGGAGVVTPVYDIPTDKTVVTATGGATPPQQRITSVTVSGGTVTLTYETTPLFTYHVEATASVSSISWSTVSGSTTNATGTSVTFSFTAGSSPEYYRTSSP